MINPDFWRGKRVFLTGHTGFKGSWLALWLLEMGAIVDGYALAPDERADLYDLFDLKTRLRRSILAPLEDRKALAKAVADAEPDIILHLAAQPIVRLSYEQPLETLSTNIMGTAHLLDAARQLDGKGAIVVVTSDKCYENIERDYAYVEDDKMGGHDPYSMSKGASELVTSSYRRSFFEQSDWRVASARSGNIFGGGDWAANRIIPDYFRAIKAGDALEIRSPNAIRPWLFVLDSLAGYLQLAERLYESDTSEQRQTFESGWNFGPDSDSIKTVAELLEAFEAASDTTPEILLDKSAQPHEANLLSLNSTKARQTLNWHPVYGFERGTQATVAWYEANLRGDNMADISKGQIQDFMAEAAAKG